MSEEATTQRLTPSAQGPQRTCIGCRRKDGQSSFLRVSRDTGGRVVVSDKGGIGRSAYICPIESCLEAALAKDRLGRALKMAVSEAQKAALKEELVCKLR